MSVTTVSEALAAAEAAAAAPKTPPAAPNVRGAPARAHAKIAVTDSDVKAVELVPAAEATRSALATVRADFASAWAWRGTPPKLADLWRDRIPDTAQVPGSNQVLHAGWVIGNHAAIILTAYVYALAWALQHPARYPFAAVLAAPIVVLLVIV